VWCGPPLLAPYDRAGAAPASRQNGRKPALHSSLRWLGVNFARDRRLRQGGGEWWVWISEGLFGRVTIKIRPSIETGQPAIAGEAGPLPGPRDATRAGREPDRGGI